MNIDNCITMSMDEWAQKFIPKVNHLRDHASFSWGSENGCLYETFGEELEFIKRTLVSAPCTVWTLMEVDGQLFFGNGYHFVNRLGYFVTEHSFDPLLIYEVLDDDVEERVDGETENQECPGCAAN